MTKRILTLFFISLLTFATPMCAVQATEMEMAVAELTDEAIEVTVEGQAVVVTGAQGKELVVVSLTGRQVMKAKIDTPSQRIELNIAKGCYILKVGKVVRKIQVH
jgi:hypothetical protein